MIQKLKDKFYKFLRWTEKWTKTDMIYLAKGGFWLSSAQVVSGFSAFLLAIAFANLLPRETYGTYRYILSIISILTIPTLPGMSTALIQAVSRGYEGSFIPITKIKIKWGLLGALASISLSGYYFWQGSDTLTIVFLITAVFLPFMDIFHIYGAILGGRRLFKISTKYNVTTNIISSIIMALALFISNNLFIIILAYLFPYTLLRFIFWKITIKKFKLNNKQDPQTIPYGKHLSYIEIIGIIANNVDKILMGSLLGVGQLAIYAFALAPGIQLKSFLKPLLSISLPKLASQDKEVLKKTLPKKMLKLEIIILAGVVIYIVLAPYFYQIFFPQYIESVLYSQLYALVLLFFPQKLMERSLTAHIKKKSLYAISIINSAFKIILLLILLPLYGIYGAIFSQILPLVLNTFMLSYFFKKM